MRRGGETQVRGVIWRNKRARKELVGWRDTGDEAELTKLLQGGCGGGMSAGEVHRRQQSKHSTKPRKHKKYQSSQTHLRLRLYDSVPLKVLT